LIDPSPTHDFPFSIDVVQASCRLSEDTRYGSWGGRPWNREPFWQRQDGIFSRRKKLASVVSLKLIEEFDELKRFEIHPSGAEQVEEKVRTKGEFSKG
jgi:hypothetical protein